MFRFLPVGHIERLLAWVRSHSLLIMASVTIVVVGMTLCLVGFPYFSPPGWFLSRDLWSRVLQARFV